MFIYHQQSVFSTHESVRLRAFTLTKPLPGGERKPQRVRRRDAGYELNTLVTVDCPHKGWPRVTRGEADAQILPTEQFERYTEFPFK